MSLTRRETEVVAALVTGEKYAAIADRLGLSRRQLYRHSAAIRRKAGAVSTVQAVAVLIRLGVIL